MEKPQIVVIEIAKNGSDRALYINKQQVLSADPSCGDNVTHVYEVAKSMALALNGQVLTVPYSPSEGWNWEEVSEAVFGAGELDTPSISLWNDDSVQFARLIWEIDAAIGLNNEYLKEIAESMDLELFDVISLVERAKARFETTKKDDLFRVYEKDRDSREYDFATLVENTVKRIIKNNNASQGDEMEFEWFDEIEIPMPVRELRKLLPKAYLVISDAHMFFETLVKQPSFDLHDAAKHSTRDAYISLLQDKCSETLRS